MNTSGNWWSTSIPTSESKIDGANLLHLLRRRCRWRKKQQLGDELKQLRRSDKIGQIDEIWNLALSARIINAGSFPMLTRCCLGDGDYQLDGGGMLLAKRWNRVIKLWALEEDNNGRGWMNALDTLEWVYIVCLDVLEGSSSIWDVSQTWSTAKGLNFGFAWMGPTS